MPPNTSLDVVAQVHAPAVAGAYLIQWDALREGVAWFSWRGSPTAPMNLLVLAAQQPSTPVALDEPVALPRPARVQYWTAAFGMVHAGALRTKMKSPSKIPSSIIDSPFTRSANTSRPLPPRRKLSIRTESSTKRGWR